MSVSRATVDESADELARRQVMATAATDLERAGAKVREVAEVPWPVEPQRVDEARASLLLVHESLAAVDSLGWPHTS